MATQHHQMALESTNGFRPDMPDEELLSELTLETVGHSYRDVRLKITRGEQVIHRKVRLQPVDIFKVAQQLEALTAEDKAEILAATAPARSAAYADENWLEALAVCLHAFMPPMTLRDPQTKEVLWIAGGEPQQLVPAMKALPAIGLDMWHINELSRQAIRMTRDISDAELSGNS